MLQQRRLLFDQPRRNHDSLSDDISHYARIKIGYQMIRSNLDKTQDCDRQEISEKKNHPK
jgi:hypothetical protein